MRIKTLATFAALSLALGLVGIGCQQQGGPKSSSKVKGLDRVHFALDQAGLTSDAKKTLKDNASYLKKNEGLKVSVAGHCDERGTEEYNVALGQRRAKSAKDYLVSLGVASARLKTVSFGEEKPLENCHNESCWWKNRRADFVK